MAIVQNNMSYDTVDVIPDDIWIQVIRAMVSSYIEQTTDPVLKVAEGIKNFTLTCGRFAALKAIIWNDQYIVNMLYEHAERRRPDSRLGSDRKLVVATYVNYRIATHKHSQMVSCKYAKVPVYRTDVVTGRRYFVRWQRLTSTTFPNRYHPYRYLE